MCIFLKTSDIMIYDKTQQNVTISPTVLKSDKTNAIFYD